MAKVAVQWDEKDTIKFGDKETDYTYKRAISFTIPISYDQVLRRKSIIVTLLKKEKGTEQLTIDNAEFYDLSKFHLCHYCGAVAVGTYEDLLCCDCRQTFGHALFSEL